MPPERQDDDDLLEDKDDFGADTDVDTSGGPDDPKGDAKTDDDVEVVISAGGEDEPDTGEDTTDAVGEPEGEADDDLKDLSDPVRKRIMRERRLTSEARAQARTEREGRIKAQNTAYESTKSLLAVAKDNTEEKLKARRAEWIKAKDLGDNAEDVRLQGEVSKLEADLRDIEQSTTQLRPPAADTESDASLVAQWKSKNRWFDDPKFAAAAAAVRVIDAAVSKIHSPDTIDYFTELDKRIREELPHLKGRVQRLSDGTRTEQRQQRPVTGAPAPKGGQRRTAAGVVVLNKTDIKSMQDFKLDPKNPEHVKEFARNKQKAG